ncbi:RimK family protein [Photobacterium atrarenae]|uniref:RimK family protein n=1 Tax=Photobacterium atrarenae TaxID=865757 RepID=A0ABY5GFZ3_9GAMM|nr:RimK family protein [Photobacterium atrarenae]UTV27522.1 RimK family protein [Photobacterium atrarenae]
MTKVLIITDNDSDWRQYFPSDRVVTVDAYLQQGAFCDQKATQIINLCRDYGYLSSGYYCSLMAEARGHRVIPRMMTITDLSQPFLLSVPSDQLEKAFADQPLAIGELLEEKIYFGHAAVPGFAKIARRLFEHFMMPVMQVSIRRTETHWQVEQITPFPFQDLTDPEQDRFADALERFSNKVWRAPKPSKNARYDLALLVDPNEKMPPSDSTALHQFKKAAKRLGMRLQTITPDDLSRLGEFDGLFIRATTNIDNFTYRFAKTAEKLGLVVMDDPESIMKCTNKVFLTELLHLHHIPAPKSAVLKRFDPNWLALAETEIGYPMVLKVPDGAFSVGVVKVSDREQLLVQMDSLFARSTLILAQEFLPTDFDWRIGILNRQPLFACKYYMSRGHWQIYQHHQSGRISSGGFETLDLKQVPKAVIDTALKAANQIGSGLYGVDLKEVDGQVRVIEVNDNPSIDHKVEDAFLGDLLYDRVMTEFLRRIQLRGF